jgi:hypothetical protein
MGSRADFPDTTRKGPLGFKIAKPLETTLRNRLADSQKEGGIKGGQLNITRIKIVSVAHDVVGLSGTVPGRSSQKT